MTVSLFVVFLLCSIKITPGTTALLPTSFLSRLYAQILELAFPTDLNRQRGILFEQIAIDTQLLLVEFQIGITNY